MGAPAIRSRGFNQFRALGRHSRATCVGWLLAAPAYFTGQIHKTSIGRQRQAHRAALAYPADGKHYNAASDYQQYFVVGVPFGAQ